MKDLKIIFLAILCVAVVSTSCKKDIPEPIYGVNQVTVSPPNTEKTKEKNNSQYVSILYANLFQDALSANELFDFSQVIESIGDKEIAREVIISNFMNKSGLVLPDELFMRENIEVFIEDTYERFLIRRPTQAEKTWFKNYIESNPNVTPELVYFSFALSSEYLYY